MHHTGDADPGQKHGDKNREGEIAREILRRGGDGPCTPADGVGLQAQAFQNRSQLIHKRIDVHAGGQFEVHPMAHKAAFLQQAGLVKIAQGNVNPRADQGKRQGFAGNLAQLAGDAKLLLADLDEIADPRVELQHDVLVNQSARAAMKSGRRIGRLGFQHAVVGKCAADRPHLDEAGIPAAGEISHGGKADLARLIAADGTKERFIVRRKRFAAVERKIGAEQALGLRLDARLQVLAKREHCDYRGDGQDNAGHRQQQRPQAAPPVAQRETPHPKFPQAFHIKSRQSNLRPILSRNVS